MKPYFARILMASGLAMLLSAAGMGAMGIWRERTDRKSFDGRIGTAPDRGRSVDGLGILRIDRLGMSVLVRPTASAADLARGAGWIEGTAPPGSAGNTGIAGHRDTFFRGLALVRKGDEITLATPNAFTRYRVTSLSVVDPDRVSVLEPSASSILTLVTCYPFHYIGPAPRRYIVRAALEHFPNRLSDRRKKRL